MHNKSVLTSTPPAVRKPLRLSKETARALGRIRMAVFFPVHPFDFRVFPAAVSVMASAAIVVLCMRTFDGPLISPPVEQSIMVTVLDRDPEPELDNPRQAASSPDESPVVAAPTEVPPPPVRQVADTELPALVLRLTRRVDPAAFTPTWIDGPAVASPAVRPVDGGDLGAFWQQVRGLIAAKAVYPPSAVRLNASGQVVLRVRIGPHGELVQADVATSSANGALDRAALSAVREATPFPVLSVERGTVTNGLEALIPVRFELVDGPAGQPPVTMRGIP